MTPYGVIPGTEKVKRVLSLSINPHSPYKGSTLIIWGGMVKNAKKKIRSDPSQKKKFIQGALRKRKILFKGPPKKKMFCQFRSNPKKIFFYIFPVKPCYRGSLKKTKLFAEILTMPPSQMINGRSLNRPCPDLGLNHPWVWQWPDDWKIHLLCPLPSVVQVDHRILFVMNGRTNNMLLILNK